MQLWTGSTTSTCGIGYVPGSTTSAPPLMSAVNALCFKSSGLTVTHEVRRWCPCQGTTVDIMVKCTMHQPIEQPCRECMHWAAPLTPLLLPLLCVLLQLGHNQGCHHLSTDTGSLPDYAAGFRV